MIDEKAKTDTEIAQRKIFIGGLSYSTDDEKLKNYFSVHGKVQDAVVMKDPVSKRSRGFGFITFTDIESVDLALAHEPHTIDARKVEAKRAVPRSEAPREISVPKLTTLSPSSNSLGMAQSESSNTLDSSPGQRSGFKNVLDPRATVNDYMYNKIFVGGLHYDTRDADFRSYFEKYGKIITAEVMFNRETHKSRGFGFIVYESEDGVNAVCDVKEHVINGKAVEVKRAIPRSKISSDSKSQGDNSYPASPITSPTDSNYNLEKLLMSQHGSTNSLSQLNASSYASILKLGSDFLSNSQHGQQNMSQEAMLRNMLLNDSLGTNTDQLLHLMSIDAQNQLNMKRAAAYAAATNPMNTSSSSQYGSYDMLSNLNTQRKLSASMPASRSGSHDFTRGNDLWLPPQHTNTSSSSSLNYADPLSSYSTSSSSTNYLSNMDLYQDKSIQLLASSLSSRTNSVSRATTSRQYFDCVRNLNSLSTLPSSYFNTEQHGNTNMSSSSLLPSQTIGNSSSLQDLPYTSTTAQMNSTPNTMNQSLNTMNNFPSYPSPKSLSPPSYLTPSLFSSHNTSVASLLSSPITNGSSHNNTHNNYNNNSTMLHATGNMNNSNNFTSNSFNIPSLSAWTDMITRSSNNTVNTMTTHESKASLTSTQQQQSHPSCSSSSSSAASYSPFYSSSLGPLNTTSNINNTTTTTAATTSVGISTDSSHGVIGGPSQRPHSASFSVIPQKLSDIWGTSNTVSSSSTGLSSSYSGPSFTSLYESLMLSSSSSTLTSPPPTTTANVTVTTGAGTSQSYSSPSKSSKSLNDIVNSTLSNKINDNASSVHMTSYTTTSLPQTPSPPPLLSSESSQMDSIRMTPPSISMNPHPMDNFLSTIDTSSLLKLAVSTTTSPYTPSRPIIHGSGMLTTLLYDENIDNNNMNLKDDSITISLPESMSESSSQQDLTSALIHSTLKYLSTTPSSSTPNVTPNPAMFTSTAKSSANSTTTTPNRKTNDSSNMMNTTTTTPPPNTPTTTTTTPTTNSMIKNDITDDLIYQYHGLNLNSQAFDPSKPYEWSSTKIA